MLFGNPFGGESLCLQTIVGTENVSFPFCKCLAYHREYLAKQLTTLNLGVGKAFASLVLYVVLALQDSVLISKFCIGKIGHFNKREKENGLAHEI